MWYKPAALVNAAGAASACATVAEKAHPVGRLGTADEIAVVVCFFASDDAAFVTGASLVADGGVMAHTGIPGPDERRKETLMDITIAHDRGGLR